MAGLGLERCVLVSWEIKEWGGDKICQGVTGKGSELFVWGSRFGCGFF